MHQSSPSISCALSRLERWSIRGCRNKIQSLKRWELVRSGPLRLSIERLEYVHVKYVAHDDNINPKTANGRFQMTSISISISFSFRCR